MTNIESSQANATAPGSSASKITQEDTTQLVTYASMQHKASVDYTVFKGYWTNAHATVLTRFPGLLFYTVQIFDTKPPANLWPLGAGVAKMTVSLDGSAENGFATTADQTAYGNRASQFLPHDEPNFFGYIGAYASPQGGTHTYIDQETNQARNGPDQLYRLQVYFGRKANDAASAQWLRNTATAFAKDTTIQKLRLHIFTPYDNANPVSSTPGINHHVDADRINLAMLEIAFKNAQAASTFFGTSAFKNSLPQQAQYVQSIGAFLVNEVYDFVRLGTPTTAGVRGSFTAQLISELNATDQTTPAVVQLFLPQAS